LGWANHSWNNHEWNPVTQWERRRDLVEQTYPGKKDYENHFFSLLDAFGDHRYIKVDGKPLFVIYNFGGLPNPSEFMDVWNNLAVKHGLQEIHFVGGAPSGKTLEVLSLGVNAVNSNGQWMAEEYVKGRFLKQLHARINRYVGGFVLEVYKYKDIINHIYNEADRLENVYPTILSQWDRSPRSGRRAVIYTGSSPKLFEAHIQNALTFIEHKAPEHKILFLKSWNEWAEGNYVEPDLVYGNGYLNVLNETLYK
jgi:hypothetical protein